MPPIDRHSEEERGASKFVCGSRQMYCKHFILRGHFQRGPGIQPSERLLAWGITRGSQGGIPYKTSVPKNSHGDRGVQQQEDASLFFKNGKKIGQEAYYMVLRFTILPWLKATYSEDNYIWNQDGAPSHTSAQFQKFCADNVAEFWPKDMWQSSSPDLNPLDFAALSTLEKETNWTFHPNVDSLKATIVKEWNNLSEKFITNWCKTFRRRVGHVIAAEGGHIE
uniref:Tc1-like transposase DDE domain-containing protein n=1 Tax=Lepeophtheirus salmonis TaxID=72036 RepID=A0A0K2TK09_LEPSM